MPPRRQPQPSACSRRPLGRIAGFLLWLALLPVLLLPASTAAQILPAPGPGPAEAPAAETAEDAATVSEALRLLAIVLDDPEARAALVEQLRAAEPPPPASTAPEAPVDVTVPEILAEETLHLAEEVSRQVLAIGAELIAFGEIVERARDFDYAAARESIQPLLIVIAAVLLALVLLRAGARPLLVRFEGSAGDADTALAPLRWKFFGLLLEIVRVAIAWAIGFGTALLIGGGTIALEQGIFLSAFLWIELARAAVRVVLRPRHPGLRLILMRDDTARRWYFWVARIIGVFGYGTLFLAPLAARVGAERLSGWLMLVSALLAMLMAVVFVFRNRQTVRHGLEARLKGESGSVITTWLYPLAHYWHVIAIGYIIALFVVWRAVPGDAVGFMIRATLASALVILLGSFLIALLTRAIADGVRVDQRLRERFPLLETRLNRLVPAALQVLRLAFALFIVASILTFWGIFDAPAWFGSPAGRRIVGSFLWVFAVLVVAGAIWLLVSSWVEYRLNPDIGTAPTPRERTLLALFSNAFVILLAVITAMTVLTEIGINIAPLLAGAGVVGLAIGFGAQKLVQDIINGAFIQFEDTMNEGDVVTAGGVTGVVEKLTIRSVSLRDLNGHYHMIPFSSVDTVTNFMKGFSFHVAEIDIAYRENIRDVKDAMQEAFDRLMETEHRANVLPPLEMQGIVAFLDSGITMRARIKTLPGKQWTTGRAYSELIKEVFDERDIEIPFPHRTLYMGVDKEGGAPPLNIRDIARKRSAGTATRPTREDDRPAGQRASTGAAGPSEPDIPGPDEV